MSQNGNFFGPFELLGLLGSADMETIERRAEALAALLKLGLAPPEGDAVALPEELTRTPEDVVEAARTLRDPQQWLREVLLWPDGQASDRALDAAAELLEGAAGKPSEPASLVRHLAHQYLADEVNREPLENLSSRSEGPDRWISRRLTPPAKPPFFIGLTDLQQKERGDDEAGDN